jgi:putative hydrolases of HD superfamily
MADMNTLSFITDICGALKTIKRTGWVRHGIPFPESDADHLHRCAMMAMLVAQPADPRDDYGNDAAAGQFHPNAVDTTKILRMALTHDLCEALAGDITPFCDEHMVASRYDKEDAAMRAIRQKVDDPLGAELYELWHEYEQQETVEARYCKDIDKFEMVVQAYEYERQHLRDNNRERQSQYNEDDSATSTLQHDAISTSASVPTSGNNNSNVAVIERDVLDEPLRSFFITTNAVIKSPLFRRLDHELRTKREEMLLERGWQVTEAERQQQ